MTWAGVAALVAAALALGLRPTAGSGTLSARAEGIEAGLRCPVCQGLSVKDSDSPTARDIRADIRRRVADGQTAGDIRQAYADRYGQWILLRPRSSGFGALVWAVPVAALAGGGVALGGLFWRWRRRGSSRAPTDDERRLVATAVNGSPP